MDGRVHSFVDVAAENASALYYNALETSVANRYVVIHRQFYEGDGYGLLDRKSGTFASFDGYPLLSPDGRWLAVAGGGENDPGLLQIFEVADGKFRLAFDATPSGWWPRQVAWQSPTDLDYERATLAALPDSAVETIKAALVFDAGTWSEHDVAVVSAAAQATRDRHSLQMEADTLQQQVEQAVQHGDMAAVLQDMNRYHELYQVVFPEPDADGVGPGIWRPPVPASLWLAQARAAFAAGDAIRAAAALQAFLDNAGADAAGHAEATALRERYMKAAAEARAERSRAAQAAKPRLVRAIEQQMVDIPAGTFQMGDLSGANQYDHKPVFETVTVKAFRLSRYEVTYAQFDQYADATGRERPRQLVVHGPPWEFADEFAGERGQLPVANVGWNDVQGFIAWLNQRTGHSFRLPTEAEWEYAARGGSHGDYPWGDTFDTHRANGKGIGPGDRWYFTAPVGSFPPDARGLYDMLGNVWELTQDCYEERFGTAPADGSARGGPPDCRRVERGGGSRWPPHYLFSSSRLESGMPDSGDADSGLRLAEDR